MRRRDTGDQIHFLTVHGGKHHGSRAQLALELIDGGTQSLDIYPVDPCGQYLETVDVDRLGRQVFALGGRQA
jgi:hypothetical protein